MGYKKIGCLRQIWYVIKYAVSSWIEWQDAKCWAKDIHPGWVIMATKCRNEETRQYYKIKILAAYRGDNDAE